MGCFKGVQGLFDCFFCVVRLGCFFVWRVDLLFGCDTCGGFAVFGFC